MAKVFISLIELPKRGDDADEAPSMSVERLEILDRERPCGQSTIRHPESARDTRSPAVREAVAAQQEPCNRLGRATWCQKCMIPAAGETRSHRFQS